MIDVNSKQFSIIGLLIRRFPENYSKISIFIVVHSLGYIDHKVKNDEKTTSTRYPLYIKTQICIRNIQIKKLNIWPHSKILPQKAAFADWKNVIKVGWWWLLPVWCRQEQLKSLSNPKWHSEITRMIQNNSHSSQTEFNQNQIKNTEVKKIRY